MNIHQVLVILTLASLGSVTHGQQGLSGGCNSLTLDTNTKGPSSFYYSGCQCQTWIIKPRNYSMINLDVSWREKLDSCLRIPPLYIYAGDSLVYPKIGANVRCGVKFEKGLVSHGSILVDFRGRQSCKGSYSFTVTWTTSLTTEPVQPPQPACGSGPAPRSSKVIGGDEAVDYWHPMVALYFYGRQQCGGTIISGQWILTAAHCVLGLTSDQIMIIYATRDINTGLTKRVSQIISHGNFDGNIGNYPNDIALLRLDSPVMLEGIVGTACLPTSVVKPGENVTVVGYGETTYPNGQSSDLLYEVTVPVIEHSQCASSYANHTENIVIDSALHICAGVTGKDSCQGDSGGPMFYYQNGTWEVHGIVSFGIGCALSGYPGVYTNVINYVDWIRTNCNNCI